MSNQCAECLEKLDYYGLCSCVEHPALCTGSPLPKEIHDVDDSQFRHASMIAQMEDSHCIHPVVAMRIRYHDEYGALPIEESFTYTETSPLIALRFAAQIAKAAMQTYAHTAKILVRSVMNKEDCWCCNEPGGKIAIRQGDIWWLCPSCSEKL